jgi:hypothetical protein
MDDLREAGGAWAWNEAKVLPLKDGPATPVASRTS